MARAIILHGWRNAPSVIIPGGWTKTLVFIVVAPLMGFVLGFGFMLAISWIFQRKSPRQVDKLFRKLQLLSAAAYSLGHGGNDAQKTMGIVAGALYTAGVMKQTDFAANWGRWHWPIILAAHTSIALGTYFGGWRIVHTMGSKILAEAGGRLLCGGRRSNHSIRYSSGGNSGQHHAYDYRCDYWGGNHQPPFSGPLGHSAANQCGRGF